MTTDIVLQSPALSGAQTEQIAALAQAQGVLRVTAMAARLRDVNDDADTVERVNACAHANGLDVAFVPPGLRLADCRVLAMDMDSTLINIECIDELADIAGVKPQVAAITEAAMRGEITDFADSLRRRVALLKGLSVDALQHVLDHRLRLNPGAENLLASARAAGIKTLLVSGGFTFFTESLRARLGLDAAHANTLSASNGKLTGEIEGRILDAAAKQAYLKAFALAHGADVSRIIAIGDGANDLKMLGEAGFSVAYHAKPIVRTQTRYALNVSGLDGVLNWFES